MTADGERFVLVDANAILEVRTEDSHCEDTREEHCSRGESTTMSPPVKPPIAGDHARSSGLFAAFVAVGAGGMEIDGESATVAGGSAQGSCPSLPRSRATSGGARRPSSRSLTIGSVLLQRSIECA
jgi:hypothetical protein